MGAALSHIDAIWRETCARFADRPAIHVEPEHRTWTFAQLETEVAATASKLTSNEGCQERSQATGEARGVALGEGNLLASARQIVSTMEIAPEDLALAGFAAVCFLAASWRLRRVV